MLLSEKTIELARSDLGVHEVGGNNRGPRVESYLAMVGLPPGQPWCCAALWTWVELASRQCGLPNPLPRTGSCLRLFELSPHDRYLSDPAPGLVYVLKHSEISGHVGIITELNSDGTVSEISGNTNQEGSREGNCVWQHTGSSPEIIHGGELLGYLSLD